MANSVVTVQHTHTHTHRYGSYTLLVSRGKCDRRRRGLFYLVNGLQAGPKSCYYSPLIPSYILPPFLKIHYTTLVLGYKVQQTKRRDKNHIHVTTCKGPAFCSKHYHLVSFPYLTSWTCVILSSLFWLASPHLQYILCRSTETTSQEGPKLSYNTFRTSINCQSGLISRSHIFIPEKKS